MYREAIPIEEVEFVYMGIGGDCMKVLSVVAPHFLPTSFILNERKGGEEE